MIGRLAWTSLVRHRARTVLAVAGVAVTAAMLLDMVMLATGMRESFRRLLISRGFDMRLAPRGTLPFDTEATIANADSIRRMLLADPQVVAVSPVLGGQLHLVAGDATVTAAALGVDAAVQGDYELAAGHDLRAPDEILVSDGLRTAGKLAVGDTVRAAGGYDAQLRTFTGERQLVVAGVARFVYLAAGQRAVAMPIATLRAMSGRDRADRVSLFMVRARKGSDIESVRRRIEREFPTVSAISTAAAMKQVDQRLSYFRQLAFILGAISLIVGFLLVTTLMTVSVNERLGEIAVLRAIGVSRFHVVWQIVLEGAGIMTTGAALGLALGLVTARYLDTILAGFPGLPARIDFFLFQPVDAWSALGMLAAAGVLAGIYPAWRGASLPIARTLREEAIG